MVKRPGGRRQLGKQIVEEGVVVAHDAPAAEAPLAPGEARRP